MRLGIYTWTLLLGIGLLAAGGAFGGAADVTQTASAYCSEEYYALTGDCNPCYTVGRPLADPYRNLTGGSLVCPY